jgi:hypothetical protein
MLRLNRLMVRLTRWLACAGLLVAGLLAGRPFQDVAARQPAIPVASLEPAPAIAFPADSDSNSPAVWSLVGGRQYLYVFNSVNGRTTQTRGLALDRLTPLNAVRWSPATPSGGTWIEAIVPDPSGTNWYGYYHNEREDVVCPGTGKVIPRIGAARSSDRGLTWRDLGTVIEAPPGSERCDTSNHYFVGGVGDFSVMLDQAQQYLYFYYTQYFEKDAEVGVAVARMTWANRNSPVNKAEVWNRGAWLPGSTQRVVQADGRTANRFVHFPATPLVKALDSWDGGSPAVDVYWGPSLHWNTSLEMYVMLLNRAASSAWTQQGTYISYSPTLDDPRAWSPPVKLFDGGAWYPQVVGTEADGTDKRAGEVARFFMGGRSEHLIRFSRE